jgi:MFS family permease
MMHMAPIWGSLADRYGRRVMLIRATLAGSVIAFLMGLAASPQQLVLLRILQGGLCGTVAAAVTLVSTSTPDENLGTALGVMQTSQFVGQAMGPVIGGVLADAFGYRAVFPISSLLMAISLLLVVFLVREKFEAPARSAEHKAPEPTCRPAGHAESEHRGVAGQPGEHQFRPMVLSPDPVAVREIADRRPVTDCDSVWHGLVGERLDVVVAALFLGRPG